MSSVKIKITPSMYVCFLKCINACLKIVWFQHVLILFFLIDNRDSFNMKFQKPSKNAPFSPGWFQRSVFQSNGMLPMKHNSFLLNKTITNSRHGLKRHCDVLKRTKGQGNNPPTKGILTGLFWLNISNNNVTSRYTNSETPYNQSSGVSTKTTGHIRCLYGLKI